MNEYLIGDMQQNQPNWTAIIILSCIGMVIVLAIVCLIHMHDENKLIVQANMTLLNGASGRLLRNPNTEDTEEWPVCVRESHCHVCSVWLRRVVASEARLRKILEVLGVWLADNDLDGQVLCETGIDLRKEQKHE